MLLFFRTKLGSKFSAGEHDDYVDDDNDDDDDDDAAFTFGLRRQWTYFMRTLPDIGSLLQPLERAISDVTALRQSAI